MRMLEVIRNIVRMTSQLLFGPEVNGDADEEDGEDSAHRDGVEGGCDICSGEGTGKQANRERKGGVDIDILILIVFPGTKGTNGQEEGGKGRALGFVLAHAEEKDEGRDDDDAPADAEKTT